MSASPWEKCKEGAVKNESCLFALFFSGCISCVGLRPPHKPNPLPPLICHDSLNQGHSMCPPLLMVYYVTWNLKSVRKSIMNKVKPSSTLGNCIFQFQIFWRFLEINSRSNLTIFMFGIIPNIPVNSCRASVWQWNWFFFRVLHLSSSVCSK